MKIALIGATGHVGSRLLAEALRRQHQVTAIVRIPSRLPAAPNLIVKQGDVGNGQSLSELLKGHDVVLSAFNAQRGSAGYSEYVLRGYQTIINATKKSGAKRLLVVGGAGSLYVAPGLQLVHTPNFPESYKAESLAFTAVLEMLQKESALEWTLLSPSASFAPGERTGKFRLGGDELLTDAKGESHISMEDFAIAMLDEVEHPKHLRGRFTVGY